MNKVIVVQLRLKLAYRDVCYTYMKLNFIAVGRLNVITLGHTLNILLAHSNLNHMVNYMSSSHYTFDI